MTTASRGAAPNTRVALASTPLQNRLLAALPATAQSQLFPDLELVSMPLGMVLYEPGGLLRHAYFPVDCIVALQYVMENGASAEMAIVGNDGVVGLALITGGENTSSRAVVQNAGMAYRVLSKRLKEEFYRHEGLLDLLLLYTQALLTQMSQTSVCNRHHQIDQQLSCWLLNCLDRLPGNSINLTQELIASMLGVRREGITDAAGKLQKLGIIEYSRGRITILDRPRLEQVSCECYQVVRKETGRLLPWLVAGKP
jgi:CRP-like cAMP-binding protein